MKLFHLSDLHIGLKLYNRDLREDHLFVFRQVIDYAAKELPDAVVIAGDLYDKAVPSAESVAVFDWFISALSETIPEAEIMLISGNHDSAPRIDCFRSVLKKQHLHLVGLPPLTQEDHIETVSLQDEYGTVRFYLLPFVRPSMVKMIVGTDENGNNLSYEASVRGLLQREAIDSSVRNVLVSHQFYLPDGKQPEEIDRTDAEIRTAGNIDAVSASLLNPFDYAALGHIHKPMKAGSDRFRYCGTPLPCSVSEAGQPKGVIMAELREKGTVRTTVLPLTPLHEVRKISGTLEDVLLQACDDYVSVLLTDRTDFDVFDLQDRIRSAFPNLLEIRRELWQPQNYSAPVSPAEYLDPFTLCCRFLQNPSERDQELLREVINTSILR